jgi:hypothetical protein
MHYGGGGSAESILLLRLREFISLWRAAQSHQESQQTKEKESSESEYMCARLRGQAHIFLS